MPTINIPGESLAPTKEHQVEKSQKTVAGLVGLLPKNSSLHQLFARKGLEDYIDAEDDTVSMRVEGRIPSRRYKFRNDRSEEIKFDTYKERKVSATMGDHLYSAVKITDEQRDFDLLSPNNLVVRQASAVGEDLHALCRDEIEKAPFPFVIGGAVYNLRRALSEARKVMNKLRVPGNRYLIVGSDFEQELILDEKLTMANYVGETQASNALHQAILGDLLGFTIVRDDTIDPEAAYAMVDGGFILLNGAPSVPESVPFGASTSYDGVALTWLRQYDIRRFQDQSVVHTWAGTNLVKDIFLDYKFDDSRPTATPEFVEVVGEEEHFVRAFKLTLEGESAGPAVGSPLALDVDYDEARVWEGKAPAAA